MSGVETGGDRFERFRGRIRRSYWTMGLQAVEVGDVLSTENHARVYELLPEDGATLHTADAQGRVVLLIAIPEEQLTVFAESEWPVAFRYNPPGQLELLILPGEDHQLECPFEFNLTDPQSVQEAIQLTERSEVSVFGVTHMEEGLMLTLKGEVGLPKLFQAELREALIAALGQHESAAPGG